MIAAAVIAPASPSPGRREDMVLVPRDLSYLQAARLATALGYTIAEMADVYGFVLDTLATVTIEKKP